MWVETLKLLMLYYNNVKSVMTINVSMLYKDDALDIIMSFMCTDHAWEGTWFS